MSKHRRERDSNSPLKGVKHEVKPMKEEYKDPMIKHSKLFASPSPEKQV